MWPMTPKVQEFFFWAENPKWSFSFWDLFLRTLMIQWYLFLLGRNCMFTHVYSFLSIIQPHLQVVWYFPVTTTSWQRLIEMYRSPGEGRVRVGIYSFHWAKDDQPHVWQSSNLFNAPYWAVGCWFFHQDAPPSWMLMCHSSRNLMFLCFFVEYCKDLKKIFNPPPKVKHGTWT